MTEEDIVCLEVIFCESKNRFTGIARAKPESWTLGGEEMWSIICLCP